jgi:ketosteroid isomerase-like protein
MTLSVDRAGDSPTIEFMASFADAWNRHDADAVVAHMTEDCIYEASSGPEPWGDRYVGRQAMRAAVAATFAAVPDMSFSEVRTQCAATSVSASGA